MAIRNIIHYGHPTLRKKAKEIKRPDSLIRSLAQEMIEAMHHEGGIGLAAPQVNASVKLVTVDLSTPDVRVDPIVLINPRVVEQEKDEWDFEEGCLSVPEIRHNVVRPGTVTVEAIDLDGNPLVIEKAEGLLARVLMHEIDHLNGIFFVDHLDEETRDRLKAALKKLEKETRRALKG